MGLGPSQFKTNQNVVDQLEEANKKFANQIELLEKTQKSIAESEQHIKAQTRYTFVILLLTAVIAGIDVYYHVFVR